MRFFEFVNGGEEIGDKLVMVLRNYIGRATSKRAPVQLNWSGLNQVLSKSGFEMGADFETFKAIYDTNPAIQSMVRSFNDQGIELVVPGAPDNKHPDGTQDSQAEVDKAADSAAAGQLAQSQATPQIAAPQA